MEGVRRIIGNKVSEVISPRKTTAELSGSCFLFSLSEWKTFPTQLLYFSIPTQAQK